MTKKVSIGTKPSNKPVPAHADAWVENREAEDADSKMKRLTIDITGSLHRKIKAQCARNGTKIADEVRELLMQKYGNVQL